MKNLNEILNEDDLFISFVVENDINIFIGDKNEILTYYNIKKEDLFSKSEEFIKYVSLREYYLNFIPEINRQNNTLPITNNLNLILFEIFKILFPKEIIQLQKFSKYKRVIIFPDDFLYYLPIHLYFLNNFKNIEYYIYAPSATSYINCVEKQTKSPKVGLIVIGDRSDSKMQAEAKMIKELYDGEIQIIDSITDLNTNQNRFSFVYIISHGWAPKTNIQSEIEEIENNYGLLFDNDLITSIDFYSEKIKLNEGALVILSACNVGRVLTNVNHDIYGLNRAIFYAGASNVISAKWPVLSDLPEPFFKIILESLFIKKIPLYQAFNEGIKYIRSLNFGKDNVSFLLIILHY